METKIHWEEVYETKDVTQVSWYQEHSELSVEFIKLTGVDKARHIIDVGGGASTLVDDLMTDGFLHITVLDISAAALQVAQKRLGSRAGSVTWLKADITRAQLPHHFYDIWHDRAVFHFLTHLKDRQRYVETVQYSVKPGGHVIVATFTQDGPKRCSGLEVVRYNPDNLHDEFGDDFELVDSTRESHQTPFGTEQKFIYCYCRKG
ncbi:class I SAM-dependent methyltransferase [Scytonema sp. NUACC26]|uniref:class I SAM-dependent methyltransferase n=1 Tax=Scytonema sp. NUACC26 TaxID=3140176 RepID=UPI0034DC6884